MFGHWFCAFAGYMFMFIFPFGFFNTHKAFVWNCMWPKKRQDMYFQSRRSPLKNSINHKEKFVKISEFQKPHKNAHCVFISAPLGTPAIELKKVHFAIKLLTQRTQLSLHLFKGFLAFFCISYWLVHPYQAGGQV